MNNLSLEKATFAGGCFWCMQHPFDALNGVITTTVGYTAGNKENPTYEEVCSGTTGHVEAIEVQFDPSQVTYSKLLEFFWKNINPTTANRQFADVGSQYRTLILYHSEEQRQTAESSKEEMNKSGVFDKPIVTEVRPASIFYKAEENHQKYYEKYPGRYERYMSGSGRERYLNKKWNNQV